MDERDFRCVLSHLKLVDKEIEEEAVTLKASYYKIHPFVVTTKQPAEMVHMKADVLKNPSNSQN